MNISLLVVHFDETHRRLYSAHYTRRPDSAQKCVCVCVCGLFTLNDSFEMKYEKKDEMKMEINLSVWKIAI